MHCEESLNVLKQNWATREPHERQPETSSLVEMATCIVNLRCVFIGYIAKSYIKLGALKHNGTPQGHLTLK
jgi:hypothetical protein